MNPVLLKRRSSDCLCSQPSKVLSGCNQQRKRLNFAPTNWSILFWKTSFLFSFLESRVGENFENGNRTFPLSFIFLFFFPFLFCSRNQEEDRTKDNEARDNEDE